MGHLYGSLQNQPLCFESPKGNLRIPCLFLVKYYQKNKHPLSPLRVHELTGNE